MQEAILDNNLHYIPEDNLNAVAGCLSSHGALLRITNNRCKGDNIC